MSAISAIDVRVATSAGSGAGTDGEVYVGVAGREFYIDRSGQDDFEAGSDTTYHLGDSSMTNRAQNSPTNPPLDTADLFKFPVYLRFEPEGSDPEWHLEGVRVTVNPGATEIKYGALVGGPDIWLGQKSGKFCYLERI
jgi:PLAT/LH2 domain